MAIFTLAEARALLPQVREITQHYHDRVEKARERADDIQASGEREALEQHMQNLMREWASEIVALGVEV